MLGSRTIDTYTAYDLVSYGIDTPGARTTIDMYSGSDLINAGVVAGSITSVTTVLNCMTSYYNLMDFH